MPDRSLAATRACVFDAYGTLFDLTSAARRCADALGDKAEALGALWRTRQLEYSWLRSLMGAHADFWQVTGESLDYALAVLGIADAALRARLMDAFLHIQAYPDAVTVLDALKRARRPAAILSNGSPRMLSAAAAQFGFKAVWANRAGAPRERLPGEPAAELSGLDRLPALLGI